MKKLMVLLVVMVLAGCGAQKSDLNIGHAFVKDGNCAEALPYLDQTISNPDDLMDIAYAFFLKARCAEKAGEIAKAYEYLYATKRVTCYSVEHETNVNLNTYARSEYCQEGLPAKLKELEPSAGDVKAIRQQVDSRLHAKYLEQFVVNK
tara:strand:- start:81 stop:527 length:447 start_codon:yes stop_codon:yes gene_type:complete